MLKLVKYVKPYIFMVLIIIVSLMVQAICDLSLPDYMSDIVNVGLQQQGIKKATPTAIRKQVLDKVIPFMSETERVTVLNGYLTIGPDGYNEKYPLSKSEDIYVLKDGLSVEEQDALEQIFKIYIAAVGRITSTEQNTSAQNSAGQNQMQNAQTGQQVSQEEMLQMAEKAKEALSQQPDSVLTQMSAAFLAKEYEAIGIDIVKNQTNYILIAGVKMLAIALVSMIFVVLVGYVSAKLSSSVGRDLRKDLYRKVLSFSNIEFDKFSTSSLITRNTNDIQQVQMFLIMLLRVVFYAPIMGIGGVLKVQNTESSMTWILAVAVAAIIALITFMLVFVMPKFKMLQKLTDNINLVVRESLSGMLVIRAFGAEAHEEKKFEKANKELTGTNLFVSRFMGFLMPFMSIIMNLTTVSILWFGAKYIDAGTLQVGSMMAFMQYGIMILFSFLMISMVSIMMPRASVAGDRIAEVLSTDVAISDPANPETFSGKQKGEIEFRHVSFKYPNADEYVLQDISFTAKPGRTTAIIGGTGSGKSTLINLIPRFYDVTEGEILVDRKDIRKVRQSALRDMLGYIPQKGLLFTGTVESNIKFAQSGGKSISDDDMIMAAEIAQAVEFVNEKPDKYDSEITEGGTNVSGGQRQRLSIARAIAKKPAVFIFDDSFSALDFKTDKLLRSTLSERLKNVTTLIVAQRINTIRSADQIIVLNEGKIAGIGTHKELMNSCDIYRQIAESQLSKEELA